MYKDEIKQYLSKFKNVVEMINEANKLKERGESEIMVNRCVAELRKEMLAGAASIKKLTRVALIPTKFEDAGFIPVQIDDLSSSTIVFDGRNVLM